MLIYIIYMSIIAYLCLGLYRGYKYAKETQVPYGYLGSYILCVLVVVAVCWGPVSLIVGYRNYILRRHIIQQIKKIRKEGKVCQTSKK